MNRPYSGSRPRSRTTGPMNKERAGALTPALFTSSSWDPTCQVCYQTLAFGLNVRKRRSATLLTLLPNIHEVISFEEDVFKQDPSTTCQPPYSWSGPALIRSGSFNVLVLHSAFLDNR